MTAERGLNADEAANLFGPLEKASSVLVAVSGGADSMALLLLLSEWVKGRDARLTAATVNHCLRSTSEDEARKVARFAKSLGVRHKVLVWTDDKPASGIEEAARAARYRLLVGQARKTGASHLVTAHTLDDQAETVLMRLAAGSGPSGLAGMREESLREGVVHLRPLLTIPKTQLIATLQARGIDWCEDAMNRDPRFARPRLRAAREILESEGLTAGRLGLFARRMERMNRAVEKLAAVAWSDAVRQDGARTVLDGDVLLALPEEIALRVLVRAIGQHAAHAPDRLARSEALFEAVRDALAERKSLGRTLAGAKIAVRAGEVTISPAPPRRFA